MFNLANNLKAAGRNADAVEMYLSALTITQPVLTHTSLHVFQMPVAGAVQRRVLCSAGHYLGQHWCEPASDVLSI